MNLEQTYLAGTEQQSVLAARRYIPQGTLLSENLVELIKIPKSYVQQGILNSKKELKDEKGAERYLTLLPILTGEQVSKTKLLNIRFGHGLSMIMAMGTASRASPLAADLKVFPVFRFLIVPEARSISASSPSEIFWAASLDSSIGSPIFIAFR